MISKWKSLMYRGVKNVVIGILLVQCFGINRIQGAIEEDQAIVSAEIDKSYEGRDLATETLKNLDFTDVSTSFWAKETISRMGALNVVKGYNSAGGRSFRPNGNVSKEEAIAFLLRAIGQEEEAQLAAEALEQGASEGILSMWSKGYMSIAADLEMIDAQELEDSLEEEQELLDPEFSFIRGAFVTREEVAKWVVQAINSQNPEAIVPLYSQQNIYHYTDWEQMGLEFIPYIEAVMEEKIMVGNDGLFKPKAYITRAEMMQVIKNLNTILYETMKLEVKNGYIGHIDRESTSLSGGSRSEIRALVRQGNGKVDQLVGRVEVDNLGRTFQKEAVVYKQNRLVTLQDLEEGDTIEYIVNTTDNTVVYVYVKNSDQAYTVSGILQPFARLTEGILTLENDSEDLRNYVMADTLYNAQNNLVKINDSFVRISDVPVTNRVTLTLKNQVVTHIRYDNEVISATEISGLVIEHNPAFRYLRISDWNGNEWIKRYYEGAVTVEKQAYYDDENQIGYLDELYPYYGFDESDAEITDIEAGDIVHIRLNPSDLEYIEAISAKTNYTVQFGEVISTRDQGDQGVEVIFQMSDNTVISHLLDPEVVVKRANVNLEVQDIEAGDLVRLLVNQAVVSPGTIRESVKEVDIDPYGNIAGTIYRGKLGTINKSQQSLSVMNSYELTLSGWKNFQASRLQDISGEDIEYYYNDTRVTLEYADQYLRTTDMQMYVATEMYFSKERVKKVVFRDGRDSVLPYSNITQANGLNQLQTQNSGTSILFDSGTIIIKNGKLVSGSNLVAPDYSQVVLNGNRKAAIVSVRTEPGNDAISIFRGRISKIDEYESFSVHSHSMLSGMQWIYSPIERVFTIDYRTLIKNEEETLGINDFLGYSELSKVDEVYTIIAEGTKATHIIKNPYPTEGVLGEVYSVEEEEIGIKDVLVYDGKTKEWKELSTVNSYGVVELLHESVIIKNNKVIGADELEIGEKIRIMTTENMIEQLKLQNDRNVPGYIILVE